MILNRFENTVIHNDKLPKAWQSEMDLEDLSVFLQQNWNQRNVFYDDERVSSRQQFLSFGAQGSIKTNNYVGTIVFKGEQLNVFPKMFRIDADDNDTDSLSTNHLITNLVRWLEYCSKSEYPYIGIKSELKETSDLKQLFISLYLKFVLATIDRGVYFQYIDETSDLPYIRGRVDYVDYYTNKVPRKNQSNFRCSFSEFVFDNQINKIIKYTCWMLQEETGRVNQKIIHRILTRLSDVSFQRCTPSDCDNIRLSKMHKNYEILLNMSKMFLLNKTSNDVIGYGESFCFLFPMELMFEGFIGGFLKHAIVPMGGRVSLQANDLSLLDDVFFEGVSLGSAFNMRHDILMEMNGKLFILDTKYKQIPRFEGDHDTVRAIVSEQPKQTDIYQVCEYARKRNVDDVYLLYPMYRFEGIEPSYPIGISKNGADGKAIKVHFIRLPFIYEENDRERIDAQLLRIVESILR